jgi:hypothetical protein
MGLGSATGAVSRVSRVSRPEQKRRRVTWGRRCASVEVPVVLHNNWNDLSQYSDGLLDYEGRTLYSTWNISYQLIQGQDPSAAELLRLMAYFGN